MLLVIGLGNPGPGHARNRHNIGFMAVDAIVRRHGFTPFRSRFHGLLAEGTVSGEKVLALKPLTFMNDSGRAVGEAARYYKLPADDILVIYDELDLAPGKLKVKTGGGHAGHNGLKSIDAHLGTPEYRRVRLGIGHPGHRDLVQRHILGDFAKADEPWLTRELEAVADAFPDLVAGDDSRFMNRVATAMRPAKPEPRRDKPRETASESRAESAQPPRPARTALGAAWGAAIARLKGTRTKT
ncbi:MAG: aminoacyl-tRNA hydrolase [Alphaproteobacteria bacterium]